MSTGTEYTYFGVERSRSGWIPAVRKLRAKGPTQAMELRHTLKDMRTDTIANNRGEVIWRKPERGNLR